MTTVLTALARLRAEWDAPFLAGPADEAAHTARTGLTRRLAQAILTAPLIDGTSRTRVGELTIAAGGWSRERAAAAADVAAPGTPEWITALGDHEHVTLTGDGHAANRNQWCGCPGEVPGGEWVRYEYWTAAGCERHGYVHSACRRLLQAG